MISIDLSIWINRPFNVQLKVNHRFHQQTNAKQFDWLDALSALPPLRPHRLRQFAFTLDVGAASFAAIYWFRRRRPWKRSVPCARCPQIASDCFRLHPLNFYSAGSFRPEGLSSHSIPTLRFHQNLVHLTLDSLTIPAEFRRNSGLPALQRF